MSKREIEAKPLNEKKIVELKTYQLGHMTIIVAQPTDNGPADYLFRGTFNVSSPAPSGVAMTRQIMRTMLIPGCTTLDEAFARWPVIAQAEAERITSETRRAMLLSGLRGPASAELGGDNGLAH